MKQNQVLKKEKIIYLIDYYEINLFQIVKKIVNSKGLILVPFF